MSRLAIALAVTLASIVGCSSSGDTQTGDADFTKTSGPPARSWSAHPAIVEVDEAGDVYAVSDVHGHYDAFLRLLVANHLVEATSSPDPKKAKWTGGAAILVIVGDLIDKGPDSLKCIDLVRALEASASRAGGRVITTMGNHEAEFFADYENDKATSTGQDAVGIDTELDGEHVDPKSLVKGTDPAGRGAWLAGLPFGVRIKKWFFAHSGNTQRMSIPDLSSKLQHSLDHNGYGDKDITGKDSILEAEKWYGDNDSNVGEKEADALGVNHIVFGHDAGAFDAPEKIGVSKSQILFRIDTHMGMHEASEVGRAFLLHVQTKGDDTAESLDETGHAKSLL